MKTGLVLEGGGMRGSYTSGALDCLMDEKIFFDYVVGVSAGACNGVSYVSEQRGRGFVVNSEYIKDKRYLSFRNFIREKSFFGMNFLFDEITNKLEPLDYKTILSNRFEFKVGVTDIETGKPVYFDKSALNNNADVLRASSAIPLFSPTVIYNGKPCLDGGTSDPIPVKQAISDGCERLLVILTQPADFVKKPEKFRAIYAKKYKSYPDMIKTMDNRHNIYNSSRVLAKTLEKEGKAFVLLPSAPLLVGRFENDKNKLIAVYNMGYNDTKKNLAKIRALFNVEDALCI